MNSKTCKKLRKEARKFCNPQYDKAEVNLVGASPFFSGRRVLVPSCFRAVYQEAKKILKSGGKAFA